MPDSPEPAGVPRYVIHTELMIVPDEVLNGPIAPPKRDPADVQPWIPFAVTPDTGKLVRIWWRKAG